MQIQFNTGVCTLLLVKVPEDAHNFDIDGTDFYFNCQFGDVRFGNPRRLIMLGKKYQFIGLSHELTEDQCHPLVKIGMDYDKLSYFNYQSDNSSFYKFPFEKSKESFESLLHHLKVYNVNPLGEYSNTHKRHLITGTWQEFQDRTGTWVVLRLEE